MFDVHQAPTFEGASSQPVWKALSPEYSNRKVTKVYKKGAVKYYSDRFYFYSGALRSYFLSGAGDPTNKFGVPSVTYTSLGRNGTTQTYETLKTKRSVKITGTFTASGKPSNGQFIPLKSKFGTISVDLFPKVATFEGTFDPFKYFPKLVAYKLNNNGQSRPFFNQYMQWWVKVKGQQLINGANL